MATARDLTCRLCLGNVTSKRALSLFSNKAMQQMWALRITSLLEVSVSKGDSFAQHICLKCVRRIQSLEKASLDLASFKASSRSAMELTRKRAIDGNAGVSPDTLRVMPRSKVARKSLDFSSKCKGS